MRFKRMVPAVLAPLYGNKKATVKVRREVDYGLIQLNKKITRKNGFLFPANYSDIPIRMPNIRQIQHIYSGELATAMLKILKTCIGTTKENLCVETARVYGFHRMTQNISEALNLAFFILVESGKVKEIEGKLKIDENAQ